MKNVKFVLLVLALLALLTACGEKAPETDYVVGLCSYVDDASLNQIEAALIERLTEGLEARGKTLRLAANNCNGDHAVMEQIIANFEADQVDLMIAVATPVALKMQAASEESGIPMVFSAVSDPVGAGLVESLEAPGAQLTGTSDYLDTAAIMELILANQPEVQTVGLLYDQGQDSSAAPIAQAKAWLEARGIAWAERTGTTTDEIKLAVDALLADGVEAIFTPTDNTVMTAQLSIYESLLKAGVPHYTGADSFALNGAFLGYGVDYEALGRETADMALEILLEGTDPGTMAVRTFDNGTATVNLEACAALGYDYEELETLFAPLCTRVQPIETAEAFQ